jgi:hypothetical protein
MYNSNNDGVDHINIYSQGRTVLGCFLSNWYRYPIVLGDLGRFESIEGLWYYISTRDERLRNMSGFAAKKLGKSLPKVVDISDDLFKECIKAAIKTKICGSPFHIQFVESVLPFDHYYVFSGKQVDAGHKWIVEYITHLRQQLKDDLNKGNIKIVT